MKLKQLLRFKDINLEVDERIEELKEKLKNLHYNYNYNVYKILKEILELRKKQIKNYEIPNLAKEKGINFNEGAIYYIFGYEHASNKSLELIDERKISASLIMTIIRRSILYRKHQLQDKIVNAVIDNKINSYQIKNIPPLKLIEMIDKNNLDLGKEDFSISIIQKANRLKREIELNKNMFNDNELKDRLKKVVRELNEIVNNLK